MSDAFNAISVSVLNLKLRMGDNRVESFGECPLCLDAFELDDQSFYPCPCEYQICRFCWHRIKSDENGLCPACRKPYSEMPAQFQPLSKEQLTTMRIDKKNKASERKIKVAESRKHLAAVRVVQKCLVFVVGLSSRIADGEMLKKPEYFGRFGKIHKCVVNNNTNYAGSTGHSASAYITFYKSDDALRAVQQTNNTQIDGRTLKASLGTTKYCSQFLKAMTCNKPDCMYLHELGDERASFTKEDMQQGKHQEYEQELHDEFYRKEAEGNLEAQMDRYKTVFTLRSEANGHAPYPLKVDAELPPSSINGPQMNGGSNRTTPSPSNAWGDANHQNSLHSPLEISGKTKPEETSGASQGFSIFSNLESSLDRGNQFKPHEVKSDPFTCVAQSSGTPWEAAVFSGETYGDPARRFLSEPATSANHRFDQPYENGIPQLLNILDNRAPDDDLEFDPIEECQKGLEELMQKERLLSCVNLSESFPPSTAVPYGASNQNSLSHSFNGFHSLNSQPAEHQMGPALHQQPFDQQQQLRALLPNVTIHFQSALPNSIHNGPQMSSAPNSGAPHTWQNAAWNNNTSNQYNISSEDPAIISTRKSHNHLSYWENNNYQKQLSAGSQFNEPSAVEAPQSQDPADAFNGPNKKTSLSKNSRQLFTNWNTKDCPAPTSPHSAPPGFKSDMN